MAHIVNVTTVNIKAHTHTVTSLYPGAWSVLSGKSGETYYVDTLAGGSCTCTCPWGVHRKTDNPASACSHVQAVAEVVAHQTHKTVALPASAKPRVQAQHRKVIDLGDGVIFKARKLANA